MELLTWDGPVVPGFVTLHRRPPFSGSGFNHEKSDYVALWFNRGSRHEVLKHYTAREPAQLKYFERMYNFRWPAHIDFARDTISFGGRWVGR